MLQEYIEKFLPVKTKLWLSASSLLLRFRPIHIFHLIPAPVHHQLPINQWRFFLRLNALWDHRLLYSRYEVCENCIWSFAELVCYHYYSLLRASRDQLRKAMGSQHRYWCAIMSAMVNDSLHSVSSLVDLKCVLFIIPTFMSVKSSVLLMWSCDPAWERQFL